MTKFLTQDEIKELTGFKRPSGQLKWLRSKGIEALSKGDGTLAVLWEAVEARMLGTKESKNKAVSPNWGAMKKIAA
jgi:hypothetical protein